MPDHKAGEILPCGRQVQFAKMFHRSSCFIASSTQAIFKGIMMPDIFFISDTHFWHKNIIAYSKRPFSSVEEMNETMIENWNAKVKASDVVYHLGDFSLGAAPFNLERASEVKSRLSGQIHLVMGNHDKPDQISALNFASVSIANEIRVGNQRISLFHFAQRAWHKDYKGAWMLYGHSHGRLPGYGKSFDVGVDAWNFAPLAFDEVKAAMQKRAVTGIR